MMEQLNEVKIDQAVMYLADKYDDGWRFTTLTTTEFWDMYVIAHKPYNMEPAFYIKDEVASILLQLPVDRKVIVKSVFYEEILPKMNILGITVGDAEGVVDELLNAVEKLPPEARITRTIRNRLRSLFGEAVEQLDWSRIGEKAGRQLWVRLTWALEAFLKLGSHKFDNHSCFRADGSNWHHRYSLAVSSGTFVGYLLRQSSESDSDESEGKFIRIGRFWGFVDPEAEAVVFTNFYGSVSSFVASKSQLIFTAKSLVNHLGLSFSPSCIAAYGRPCVAAYRNSDHVIVASKYDCYPCSQWKCPKCGKNSSSPLLEHDCFVDDNEEIFHCDRCGARLYEGEIVWIDDYPYCTDCADYCSRCGEGCLRNSMYVVGDEEWCEYCFTNFACVCEHCDNAIDESYDDCYVRIQSFIVPSQFSSVTYYKKSHPEEVILCNHCYDRLFTCDACSNPAYELIRIGDKYYCPRCYQGDSLFVEVSSSGISRIFVPKDGDAQ